MQHIERVDVERKHLEGLLKDRLNFFLVFAPVFVGVAYSVSDFYIRAGILLTRFVVSIPFTLAILRTHRLVEMALDDILKDGQHPYTKYREQICFPPNANNILICIPFVLTVMFATLAVITLLACR